MEKELNIQITFSFPETHVLEGVQACCDISTLEESEEGVQGHLTLLLGCHRQEESDCQDRFIEKFQLCRHGGNSASGGANVGKIIASVIGMS